MRIETPTEPRIAFGPRAPSTQPARTLPPHLARAHVLERCQFIPRPVAEVFAFFADAANLEVITPPWLNFRIRTPRPIEMRTGALIDYAIRWKGLPLRWRTRIEAWNPPHHFVDTQIRGPYALWHHTHTFEPTAGGVWMRDCVRYALPLGRLGRLAHALIVRRDVEAIFDYRSATIRERFPAPAT